jgi:hypothetical protein
VNIVSVLRNVLNLAINSLAMLNVLKNYNADIDVLDYVVTNVLRFAKNAVLNMKHLKYFLALSKITMLALLRLTVDMYLK